MIILKKRLLYLAIYEKAPYYDEKQNVTISTGSRMLYYSREPVVFDNETDMRKHITTIRNNYSDKKIFETVLHEDYPVTTPDIPE